MTLNNLLDSLPRAHVARYGRSLPAFQACGMAGAFLGAAIALGGAVLLGRSPAVTAMVAIVCCSTFLGWAWFNRLLLRRQRLVLFEHLWLALAAVWLALTAMHEPAAPYLDLVCAGMAWFLACGRIGCTLAGCCHGRPAEFGIRYLNRNTWPGFDERYTGIRLFPAPALESLGLVAIGTVSLLALPAAPAGRITAFFLLAYAGLRFAVEGLRGDRRPHLWGISSGRWGALLQGTATIAWIERRDPAHYYLAAGALGVLAAFYFGLRMTDPRRRILHPRHLDEIRRRMASWSATAGPAPSTETTSAGLVLGVSRQETPAYHVSLSVLKGAPDLPLLCQVATACWPALDPWSARYSSSGVLHTLTNRLEAPGEAPPDWFRLYRAILLGAEAPDSPPRAATASADAPPPAWYFSSRG